MDRYGNLHRQIGTFVTESGEELSMADVVFSMNRTRATTDMLPVPEDTAALPDARGYGTAYDLHQAMVRDTGGRLQALVAEFVAAADPEAKLALLDQILFVWTGQSEGPVTEHRPCKQETRKPPSGLRTQKPVWKLNMILTDYSLQNVDFLSPAGLTHKLSYAQSQVFR